MDDRVRAGEDVDDLAVVDQLCPHELVGRLLVLRRDVRGQHVIPVLHQLGHRGPAHLPRRSGDDDPTNGIAHPSTLAR
jgi:hypothetical protein